jgi:hypothetical protein
MELPGLSPNSYIHVSVCNLYNCRGLTRATYIICIEHPRPNRLSRESNPGPPLYCRRTLYAKSRSNGVIDYYSDPQLVLLHNIYS